jgi:hypothetical protein
MKIVICPLALACALLLGACRDRHEPTKPTVRLAAPALVAAPA